MEAGANKPKVVEVRIHGVGGEPADRLLGDPPHPILVAGDDISGFHVPGAPNEQLDLPERGRRALSWGGNTSGSWKNALWILLLPFSLMNVAGYMHRPGTGPTKRMRWLALTVTLGAVLLAAATAYDLIAIQCGGARGCVERVGLLSVYLWKFQGDSVFMCLENSTTCFPSRRLGLATLVPLGTLTLLWFAGKYAFKDLESYLNKQLHGGCDYPYKLTDQSFWNGYEPAFRTRLIHLIAGRAAIAGVLAWSIYRLDSGVDVVTLISLAVAGILLLGACVGALAMPVVHRSEPSAPLKRFLSLLQMLSWLVLGATLGISAAFAPGPVQSLILKVAAVGLALAALARVLFPARLSALLLSAAPAAAGLAGGIAFLPTIVGTEPLLGTRGTFLAGLFGAPYHFAWGIGAIQALLIISVFVTPTRPPPRPDRGTPPGPSWKPDDLTGHAFNGRGSAVLATLAIFIVLAVAAGVHRGVANYLGNPPDKDQAAVRLNSEPGVGPRDPGYSADLITVRTDLTPAIIPWWYETTAHVLVLLILGLAVTGLLFKRGLTKPVTADQLLAAREHLTSDPELENLIDLDNSDDRARLARVVQKWARARELVRVDVKVARTVWTATFFGLVLLLLQAPLGTAGLGWRQALPFTTGRPWGGMATFSLWFVGMLPIVAVLALRAAAQKETWRRQIGRLWDVLMFWPRSIQPFAPPCYSERVIPQLRLHIDRLYRQGHRVVVGGHSQGSVIAAAAVAMGPLPDRQAEEQGIDVNLRNKPDLVVYGSPISILYERSFPAYFAAEFYEGVLSRARGWHHFFARTDVFAFPFWKDEPADVNMACPVCGLVVTAETAVEPSARFTDYVLTDPVFWDWPTGEPPRPLIRGHSSYATGAHVRFEEHMKAIALRAHDDQPLPEES